MSDLNEQLAAAIRDTLGSHTVAAIVMHLQGAWTGDEIVDRQLDWFKQQLIELVGGEDMLNMLADEIGL
jgi:hypothetical protein